MHNQNAPIGNQSIHCNVQSCRHNSTGQYCALQGINVTACTQGSTGKPEDESMCASYEVR